MRITLYQQYLSFSALLTISGCFLLWYAFGDIAYYRVRGFPGGIPIAFITLLVLWFAFRRAGIHRTTRARVSYCGIMNLVFCLLNWFVVAQIAADVAGSSAGPLMLGPGLPMVTSGCALSFVASWREYLKPGSLHR